MSQFRRSTIFLSFISSIILLLGTFLLWTTNQLFQNYLLETQLKKATAEQLLHAQKLALLSSQLRYQPKSDSLWNELMDSKELWAKNQIALMSLVNTIDASMPSFETNSDLLKIAKNQINRIERPVNQLFLDFDDDSFNRHISEIQLQTQAYTNQTRLLSSSIQSHLSEQTSHWIVSIQWQAAALIVSSIIGFTLLYTETLRPASKKASEVPQSQEVVKQNQEVRLKHSLNIQKTINDNLRNAKKSAEEISQAKGKFLSMLSHEIRNPVNAILGISHLLKDDPHSEDQVENLKSLYFSAEHLRKLVDNILDLGKIEADRIELVESPFNLSQLSQEVMNSYRTLADEKEVALILEIDPRLPTEVVGDSLRISQILNNIISNAVKFTLQGEIKTSILLIEENTEKLLIGFEITDTGIGVPEDKLPVLFDEFTQAQSGTTHEFGGSGLGLAITRRLVELHGGDIRVESEINRGTKFSFELRLTKKISKESADHPVEVKEKNHSNLLNLRILAAEDDRLNKDVLKRFLRKWKATFDIVDNGALAIQLAESKYYDVILMDINMPVLDGKAAVQTIRQFNASIPIVALTGSTNEEMKQELFKAGFTAVTTKPFIPQNLFELLSGYLPQKNEA